jgi:hypothetical protein
VTATAVAAGDSGKTTAGAVVWPTFVCVTGPSLPGLLTRIETLRFVGVACAAAAATVFAMAFCATV